jgi:hypothetical protein
VFLTDDTEIEVDTFMKQLIRGGVVHFSGHWKKVHSF